MKNVNEIQKKLLELLDEVENICKVNDIDYFLSDHLAYYACTDHLYPDNFCDATIMMRTDDFNAFIDIVNKQNNPDRCIESWLNNPTYAGFSARYVNKNSLMLDVPYIHRYKEYGLSVNIDVIRYAPKGRLRRKALSLYEKGWEANHKQGKKTRGIKSLLCAAVVRFQTLLIGKKRMAKRLFNMFISHYSSADYLTKPKCFIRRFNSKRKCFSAELFRETGYGEIEGKKYRVSSKCNKYLTELYGHGWIRRKKVPTGRKPSIWTIIDPVAPYRLFLDELKNHNDINLKGVLSHRQSMTKINKVKRENRVYISKYWDTLFRTGDRFYLWEKYMPIKDELVEAYNNENFEELSLMLSEYRELIYKYYKKGLGLCFDPDILEMQIELYIMEGKQKYADKVAKLVPEQHLKPIILK